MADPGVKTRSLSRRVYRVARRPDPWMFTPWRYAPFGGRWDDPDGQYRVLYVGASRYACFLEALAGFRPDPRIVALYGALATSDADGAFETVPMGQVPAEWLDRRLVGTANTSGRVVAVGSAEVLAWLRPRVAGLLIAHRIADLDGAAIRSADRSLTQALSRWLYMLRDPDGVLDGVEFESRHGNRLVLWGLFERDTDGETSRLLTNRSAKPISHSDRDLVRALQVHRLQIG